MELQQSRYVVVDAYIEKFSDGTPVGGLDETTLLFKYKKSNESSLTTKTFFDVTGTLAENLTTGEKEVYFDLQAELDFFPMSGRLWLDKGGPNEVGPVLFTRVATLPYLTLDAALLVDHLAGEVITLHDFWEVDPATPSGLYSILLNPLDTNVLGSLVWLADPTDSANKNFIRFDTVIPATTSGVAPEEITLPNCLIYGYVLGPDGQPAENISISFRLIAEPELINEAALTSTKLVTAKTDKSGYFSVTLVQNTTVEVYIPEATFRKVFEVPASDTYELYV